MRGGPRFITSPYVTGSMGVMLIIVGFSYWSASMQNKFLTTKLEELQRELKHEAKRLEENEARCVKYQLTLKEEVDAMEVKKNDCDKKFDLLEKENIYQVGQINELEDARNRLKKEIEELKDDEDEVRLQDETASLKENIDILQNRINELEQTLEEEKLKSRDLQGKLSEILEVDPHAAARLGGGGAGGGGSGQLGEGQLPDVNPAAVNVVKKDTLGMTFHKDANGRYLPIIVQGDPRKPRPTPKYSVGNPLHERIKHSISENSGGNSLKILPQENVAAPGLQILPADSIPGPNFGPIPPPGLAQAGRRGISSTSPIPKVNKQIPMPGNVQNADVEDALKNENISQIDEHGEGLPDSVGQGEGPQGEVAENSGVADEENVEKIMEAQLQNVNSREEREGEKGEGEEEAHKDDNFEDKVDDVRVEPDNNKVDETWREAEDLDNKESDLTNPDQIDNDDQAPDGELEDKDKDNAGDVGDADVADKPALPLPVLKQESAENDVELVKDNP